MNNREHDVTQELVASILLDEPMMRELASDGTPKVQDVLRHFDASCEVTRFPASEAEARKILHLACGELVRRRRAADRLVSFLMRSAEDVVEARRDAKRAARAGVR